MKHEEHPIDTYERLSQLGEQAKPLNDDDYGSERQIESQNAFFIELEKELRPEVFAKLEDYCLKANTEEMIAAGLWYLSRSLGDPQWEGPDYSK